jgi:DNA-binding CsgD family transcriptional regulator
MWHPRRLEPDRVGPTVVGALAFATLAVVTAADLVTPRTVAFAPLVIVPVAVLAWQPQRLYLAFLAAVLALLGLVSAAGGLSVQSALTVATASLATAGVVRIARNSRAHGATGFPAALASERAAFTTRAELAVDRLALSARQLEVVRLAVLGLTMREISERLHIGERTVETHLANSYAKLGVRSKRDLIRKLSEPNP